MGRVEEAMRRALEAQNGAVAETTDVETPEAGEAMPAGAAVPDSVDDTGARRLRAVAPSAHEPARPAPSSGDDLRGVAEGLPEKVVIDPRMDPASREQYRRLAAMLHQAQVNGGLKVVMVTSAAPGEGKTLTAVNLALTFSESYHLKVLLVDADLRRPSVHLVFGIDGSVGLTDGLTAPGDQKLALHQVSDHLSVLPAGQPTSDPMSILTAERMKRVIGEAREVFDWIVIDTPPIGLLPDANLLGSIVDGALFVVKADDTPYPLVQRAIEAVGRDRVLGVILNRVTAPAAGSYNYERYYQSAPRQKVD